MLSLTAPVSLSGVSISSYLPTIITNSSWKVRGVVTLVAMGALFVLVRAFQATGSAEGEGRSDSKKPAIKPLLSPPARLKALGPKWQAWFTEAQSYAGKVPKQTLEEVERGVSALDKELRTLLNISEQEAEQYPQCIKVTTLSKATERGSVDTHVAHIFAIALLCARDATFRSQTLGIFRALSLGIRSGDSVNGPENIGTSEERMPLEAACPDFDIPRSTDRGLLELYYEAQSVGEIVGGLNITTSENQDLDATPGIQEQWRIFFFLLKKACDIDGIVTGIEFFEAYKESFLVKTCPQGLEGANSTFYILFKDSGPAIPVDDEDEEASEGAQPHYQDRVRTVKIAASASTLSSGGTEGETPIRGDARKELPPGTLLGLGEEAETL